MIYNKNESKRKQYRITADDVHNHKVWILDYTNSGYGKVKAEILVHIVHNGHFFTVKFLEDLCFLNNLLAYRAGHTFNTTTLYGITIYDRIVLK